MTEEVKTQILAIRDTGRTNMFDLKEVANLAMEYGYEELYVYLLDHRKEYCQFILTGTVRQEDAHE